MPSLTIILLLIALIWPFGQILELPFPHPQAHFYALDFLVSLLTISLLINPQYRQKIKSDPLFKPIFFFILIASLSLLPAFFNFSFSELLISISYLIRWISYTSIYFAIRISQPTMKTIKIILSSLSLFTLFGFLQYLLLPDTRFLYFFGFDDHYYRLIGTFFDPNFTGLVLIIFILLLLSSSDNRYKLASLFPSTALAFTFSRASFLVLFLSLIYLAIRSPRKIYLSILALVLVGLFLAPKPSGEGVNLLRTFSIYSRLADSQAGLQLFYQKPIFGHGFNTLRSIKVTNYFISSRSSGGFSNSFIFVAVTTGLVGLLVFLYLLFSILKLTWKQPFINTAVITIITHSLFNNSIFYIWIMVLLWSLIATIKVYKTP